MKQKIITQIVEKDLHLVQQMAYATWYTTYDNILTKEQIDYMLGMIYSLNALRKQLLEDKHHFLIAEDSEKHIAYASYALTEKDSIIKIHKIYVLPTEQGKGIGRMLIDYIKTIAIDKGINKLSLNVNRHNKALNFYESLGFEIVHEEDIPIGEGYLMEDYVLELIL